MKNLFILESQYLIKNRKIKDILNLIYLQNFNKCYDLLMTSYDIEEEMKELLAQFTFDLDYLYLVCSMVITV